MTNSNHPKHNSTLIRCFMWKRRVAPLHGLVIRASVASAMLLMGVRFLVLLLSLAGIPKQARSMAISGVALTMIGTVAWIATGPAVGRMWAAKLYPLVLVFLIIALSILWMGLAFIPRFEVKHSAIDSAIVGMSFLIVSYASGFASIILPLIYCSSDCPNDLPEQK
jgi:hypothetical protein